MNINLLHLVGPVSVDYLRNDQVLFIILGDVHFSRSGAPSEGAKNYLTVPHFLKYLAEGVGPRSTVNYFLEAPLTNISQNYLGLIAGYFPQHYHYFMNECQKDFLDDCRKSVKCRSPSIGIIPIDIRHEPGLMPEEILTKLKFVHFAGVIFRLYQKAYGKSESVVIDETPLEAAKAEIKDYFEQKHFTLAKNPLHCWLRYKAPSNPTGKILLNFYYYALDQPLFVDLVSNIKNKVFTIAEKLKLGIILSKTENEIAELSFSVPNLVYTLTRLCDVYTFFQMLSVGHQSNQPNQSSKHITVYYGGKVHSDRIILMLKDFYQLIHQTETDRIDLRYHRLAKLPSLK